MSAAHAVRAARGLGLCNLVAGALFVWAPATLLPLDGITAASGLLLTRLLAVFLVAVGIGFLWVRGPALRLYLTVFGVATKGLAGALIGGAAISSRSWWLAAVAGGDLLLALVAVFAVIGAERATAHGR